MAFPISVGSGATLASNLLNGEHLQLISPVSIYPLPTGTNFIGLATVVPGTAFPVTDNSGSLTVDWLSGATVSVASLPNVTLGSGTNFIGLATVNVANSVGLTGLLSLASGTQVGINPGTNFIGLATAVIGNTPAVTQSGTWNVGITGLTSLASGTQVGLNPSANYIGLASVNIGGSLPALAVGGNFIGLATVVAGSAFPVTDNSGSLTVDWVSGATVSVAALPNVTLGAGTAFIGLATVTIGAGGAGNGAILDGVDTAIKASVLSTASGNPVSVRQLDALPAGANFIGLVTVTIGAGGAGNGTLLDGVDATIAASVLSTASGNPLSVRQLTPLPTGANYVGLASVNIGGTLPALSVGSSFIGLATAVIGNTPAVTQSGTWNVGVNGLISLASGTLVGINPGTSFIGLATVVAGSAFPITDNSGSITVDWLSGATVSVAVLPNVTIGTGTNFIGLATAVLGASIPAGTNVIGTATTYLVPISTYTSLATIVSAAGNATLFTVPSGKRWVLKDLIITSLGRGEVQIKSGANVVIPTMALATTSGITHPFGDSGLRAVATDDSFVVNVVSAATLAVMANVRFE